MPIRRVMRLTIALAVLVVAVTGCKHYWGKPGATAEQFTADSTDCAKEASPPQLAAHGIGSEKMYRTCLRLRGWAREQRPSPPGEGWFRGIEDWD